MVRELVTDRDKLLYTLENMINLANQLNSTLDAENHQTNNSRYEACKRNKIYINDARAILKSVKP